MRQKLVSWFWLISCGCLNCYSSVGNEDGRHPPMNIQVILFLPLDFEIFLSCVLNRLERFLYWIQGYVLGNPGTDIDVDENYRVPFAFRKALISDELYQVQHANTLKILFVSSKLHLEI